ncbi:MAG: AAA family ATPase [Candidatus Binataceae bacterium]
MRERGDWDVLREEIGTVFSPGAPIDEGDLFAGRVYQIRELIDAVGQRGQHAFVFGERGVGKTSLANTFTKFMHRPVSKLVATRVNCDGIDTFPHLWKKALADWNIGDAIPAEASPDDIRRALSSVATNNIPVVVFDEFDRLVEGEVTTLMADTIKALSDHSVLATIIIVGVADSVADLIKEHASIGRNLVEVPMPRMSEDELAEILEKRLPRLDMTMADSTKRQIINYSQGLPHYTHLLGLHAARDAVENRAKHIGDKNLTASISRCLERAQQSTRDAYHKATASPRSDNLFRQVLCACALARTDELGYFTAAGVVQPMSNIMGKRYEIPSFAAHLKGFCDPSRGPILEQRGTKRKFRYRFRDPLMQPYILMQGLDAGLLQMPSRSD